MRSPNEPWCKMQPMEIPGLALHPALHWLSAPDALNDKVLKSLQDLGRKDPYRRLRGQALKDAVEMRWGRGCAQWLENAFSETAGTRYANNARRWAARGLTPPAALRKADLEAKRSHERIKRSHKKRKQRQRIAYAG